ncbi:MAG: molybdenum ABC transporter permease subunit [Deltaproteobacteria bacterium GWC2_42_11]|nr:MAG: molybdenum ABC transporter permease subunit [Deltaproteobacteria bacterium GWC2_42_11]HBO84072.1 molybdate ABC transporter permease subunit [Deltaproteobacteria bacterium]
MDLFPLYLTIKVSITATLFTASIGLVLALLIAKKDFFGKNLLEVIIMQPLVIPPTVLGYYLLSLFGRSSSIGKFMEDVLGFQIVFTWKGAVVAAFISSLPLFLTPARAAIEGVGKDIENAARLLGKSEFTILRTITLPLAWRGILAGIVMAFARATGEFGATLMIAGNIPGLTQTLPIAIYDAVQMGDDFTANILVGIITLFSFCVLYFANRFTRGRF